MVEHRREREQGPVSGTVDPERVRIQDGANSDHVLRRENIRTEKFYQRLDDLDQVSVHDFASVPVLQVVLELLQRVPLAAIFGQFEQESPEGRQPPAGLGQNLAAVPQKIAFDLFVSTDELAVFGANQRPTVAATI